MPASNTDYFTYRTAGGVSSGPIRRLEALCWQKLKEPVWKLFPPPCLKLTKDWNHKGWLLRIADQRTIRTPRLKNSEHQSKIWSSNTNLDLVRLGVSPVDFAFFVVECKAVGPTQRRVHHHHSLHPIEVGPLDLRHITPVGPVHVPEKQEGKKTLTWPCWFKGVKHLNFYKERFKMISQN